MAIGDDRAALGEDLGQQRTVAGEDARHLRRIVVALEIADRREIGLVMTDHQERAKRCKKRSPDPSKTRFEGEPNARTIAATRARSAAEARAGTGKGTTCGGAGLARAREGRRGTCGGGA